jgi:hypothetical protein
LEEESGPLEGSHQYATALLGSIQALQKMCKRLHEKSQGDIGTYPMAEYNADLKTYEGLMNRCQELGIALNQRLRDADAQPEG